MQKHFVKTHAGFVYHVGSFSIYKTLIANIIETHRIWVCLFVPADMPSAGLELGE